MKCPKCGREMFLIRDEIFREGKIVSLEGGRKLFYCDYCRIYRTEEDESTRE